MPTYLLLQYQKPPKTINVTLLVDYWVQRCYWLQFVWSNQSSDHFPTPISTSKASALAYLSNESSLLKQVYPNF